MKNTTALKFKEGDTYWAVDGNVISESVWDDVSEEINNPDVFATQEEAETFLLSNKSKEIKIQTLDNPADMQIKNF